MHDSGAGFQTAEEVDGMVGRIAEEQRDRTVLAVTGAQEGAGGGLHQCFKLGETDRPVAEFDGGARSEFGNRCRQQVGQRAARKRIVPANAFRIELLSGASHQAAFDWASDAKVLPSSARRLSSGAGSSEGSLVS